MNKILVITGPTATGKTEIAYSLAKKFGGECISADSRHVYKGMDIVTGKDLKGWKRNATGTLTVKSGKNSYTLHPYKKDSVSLWMYDVVSPDELFSVSAYTDCARTVYADITRRNALPIIVGGTGLYIASFFHSTPSLSVPPDLEFRKVAKTMNVGELSAILTDISPETYRHMNKSDKNNPRRLIRRIEIIRKLGSMPVVDSKDTNHEAQDVLWIGLTAKNTSLYNRIDHRVDARIQEGAIAEIQSLYDVYPSDLPSMSAIGYAQFTAAQSRDQKSQQYTKAVVSWKFAEHAYARRQKTWAKKQPFIQWFDVDDPDFREKVEAVVTRWYT